MISIGQQLENAKSYNTARRTAVKEQEKGNKKEILKQLAGAVGVKSSKPNKIKRRLRYLINAVESMAAQGYVVNGELFVRQIEPGLYSTLDIEV